MLTRVKEREEGLVDFCIAQELMDAEMAPALPRRRLPKGTSDYQAAWILDDYQDGEEVGGNNEVEDVEDAEEHDQDARSPLGQTAGTAVSEFGDDDVDGMEVRGRLDN